MKDGINRVGGTTGGTQICNEGESLEDVGEGENDKVEPSSPPIPVVRKQIQQLYDLYETPPVVDFSEGLGAYAVDESARARRIAELEDRLSWLTLMLEMTDGELELIRRAERDFAERSQEPRRNEQ